MIDRRTVFEIHRFKDMGFSARQIAAELRLSRPTVRKYLESPEVAVVVRKPRASKLDVYRELIDSFLEQHPNVHAPVMLQRLQKAGFDGRITIVREYLHKRRRELGRVKNGRA